METKSLPQANSVHDCFNTLHRLASSLGFNLTVIVSRSRIYANIGHGFSINFDVDLIDAIPQIFVVFRGDVVIFPKAFSKSVFQLSSEEAALSANLPIQQMGLAPELRCLPEQRYRKNLLSGCKKKERVAQQEQYRSLGLLFQDKIHN